MDDLLMQLAMEGQSLKFHSLRKAAQDASDFLNKQQGLMRDPPHELRAKCLRAIQLAFETKKSKLIAFGLSALHKILRDDRFQSPYEPEDDSLWLPAQFLHTMGSILSQSDDIQTDMLKILLQVTCCRYWTMNGRLIIAMLTTCCEVFEHGNQAVKTAARAATSQTLRSFCLFLDEESQEVDENAKLNNIRERGVSCFNEVLPILQYICCKLDEAQDIRNGFTVVFLLECLHTLISSLPQKIHTNRHFTTFLWQKFCPALIAFLGTPKVDKSFRSREGKESEIGRGSGYLISSFGFNSHQAKIVYSIGTELVRLIGCVEPLRPVLESVFHRMLLYPPPQGRLEPLKALKELLRSPSRIIDFAGPLLITEEKSNQLQSDMALIRLAMDSVEESTNAGLLVLEASVSCVVAMLSALQELCDGKAINYNYTCAINCLYADLESCDYRGPLTYQSMARLPKTYREQLELMQKSNVYNSDSSGQGPSENGDSSDTDGLSNESIEEVTNESSSFYDNTKYHLAKECERLRLEKLPKCLHNKQQFTEDYNIDIERHNARKFVKRLRQDVIPSVFSLRSSIEVDEALQNFASNYCEEVFDSQLKFQVYSESKATNYAPVTIMNADGIYLATYAALLLNLKLIRINYYDDERSQIPINEEQFVEEVHGSGVLVYLSATWLSELYQQILTCNLMEKCGYKPASNENNALVNVLIDIDGITDCRPGGQVLLDYLRLEKAQLSRNESTSESEAGEKLSRRVLTCCWDSMISVLTMGLNPNKDESAKGVLGKNDDRQGIKDIIILALDGLHKAALLSNVLGLQNRCGAIFALLAKSACSQEAKIRHTKNVLRLKLRNKATNLHTSHILSMEVLLVKGLELASHGNDCWPHVFTCCLYVSKLEHDFFGKNQSLSFSKSAKKDKKEVKYFKNNYISTEDKLQLSFNIVDDDETYVDVYSFLSSPYSRNVANESISDLIQKSNADNLFNGILSIEYAAKIVCILSQYVDHLFEDAALKLNLRALCSFLQALCLCSKEQLFKNNNCKQKGEKIWWYRRKQQAEDLNSLLLSRLGEVMIKCVKSGRPLIHIMKVWSILGPHFMEAVCHKDRSISKKAVQCIHDSMATLLNDQFELPHFHFNEALFKPFENLLCLELCDNDVQDQIVSCICEFVESNRREIRSGWRPLFGALKVASIGNSGCVESAPLLEVFRVFLTTDNTIVFTNAVHDCILCLLKHVRGVSGSEILQEELKNQSNHPIDFENRRMKLCLESLKYLLSCSNILASMYRMPACPIFHAAQRITTFYQPQYVDPIIPNMKLVYFDHIPNFQRDVIPEISHELLSTTQDSQLMNLQSIDQPSGILRVWYLLIEGLASAAMISPNKYQPHSLETLFHLLKNTLNTPGPQFGLYCINHLLLPMVQNWLRKTSNIYRGWDNFAQNFKQCGGLTTDLVVDFINHLQGPDKNRNKTFILATTLMLKQLFIVMTECIVQPTESIARLGCACFRHVLMNSGPNLTSEQWEVCAVSCQRACSNSLQKLHQLTMAFSTCSKSINGDIAQVKIGVCYDTTREEIDRLRQLVPQIFLVEDQRYKLLNQPIEEKSYVFLLDPPSVVSTPNPELHLVRVQMRALVVGLLVHQMLLQCIKSILLHKFESPMPTTSHILMNSSGFSPKHSFTFLTQLEPHHLDNFFSALDFSYITALEFDSRPGLKFLLQKVGNLCYPANLYQQASTAWTIKIFTLFELCLYEAFKNNADLQLVTELLNGIIQDNTNYRNLLKYLKLLRKSFREICNAYVNFTVDVDRRYTPADEIATKNVLLLISHFEEYSEIINKPSTQKFSSEISNVTAEYSTDSGPLSESETDNSRPPSRINFDNSRTTYLHNSENETSKNLPVTSEDLCTYASDVLCKKKPILKSKSIISDLYSYIIDNGDFLNKSDKTFEFLNNKKVNKRTSDDCLLSRRYNLQFVRKNEIDIESTKIKGLYCRSKSMLDLHRFKKEQIVEQRSIMDTSKLQEYEIKNFESQTELNKYVLEGVKNLLEEFEQKKRKYRTNPFLRNENQKMSMSRGYMNNIENKERVDCKKHDSEIRREAWAEMIRRALEFTLTLTDERLALLLPVLFDGIKILIEHAFESKLWQQMSIFFHRVASIYGLSTSAKTNYRRDCRPLI